MTTEEIIVILSNNVKALKDLKAITIDVDKNNLLDKKIADTENTINRLMQRFEKPSN